MTNKAKKAHDAGKTNSKDGSLTKVIALKDEGKWKQPESGAEFFIDEDAKFPDIAFEIDTESVGPFNWSWNIEWKAQASGLSEKGRAKKVLVTFTDKGAFTSNEKKWKADLSGKGLGGKLTVQVENGSEKFIKTVFIKAKNPGKDKVDAYLATLSDVTGFDKIIAQESKYKHILEKDGAPVVAFDKGYGLTQITNPKPTYEQVWSWKRNIDVGSTLYKQYQQAAKRMFAAHNYKYTDDMLANETLGRWNGGGYYTWNAAKKDFVVNRDIVCDPSTTNIGWPASPSNEDKTVDELHKRDADSYKKGGKGRDNTHVWVYSGICYARHILDEN